MILIVRDFHSLRITIFFRDFHLRDFLLKHLPEDQDAVQELKASLRKNNQEPDQEPDQEAGY
tara:strand:- start:533 stop:718 length:186 start_codon:yes stop_codon:yes gene_type:complete